jgi:hypothetical protein
MRDSQRGVALITVLLILLILTALGITASMMMTQEDRTSSRQDLTRVALYAAEAGLRSGESKLTGITGSDPITTTLSWTPLSIQSWTGSPTDTGNKPTQPTLAAAATWTVQPLGTYLSLNTSGTSADEVVNQPVAISLGNKFQAFFSLYVRNNPEDLGAYVTSDTDSRARLISVGFVTDQTATLNGNQLSGNYSVLAVKILEEEFAWMGSSQGATTKKDIDTGNTLVIRVSQEPNALNAVSP